MLSSRRRPIKSVPVLDNVIAIHGSSGETGGFQVSMLLDDHVQYILIKEEFILSLYKFKTQ